MSSENGEKEKKIEFAPSGFFALRTALLPFREFLDWGAESGDDRAKLRERLRALTARPEIREAIFVASPSLDQAFERWLADPQSKEGKDAEDSLARYFARMSGRSTPFGLFSGCSVGLVGEKTRLALKGRESYRRHTRLDMDYLYSLAEAMGKDPGLRQACVYRPNTSLYRTAGRLRYAEARLQGKARSYHLVGVELTDYLEATLARAAGGARLEDLASALVDDEIAREEADAYIGELVDSQILVPDLAPSSTGPEPIHDLIEKLDGFEGTKFAAKTLAQARDALGKIDASSLGVTKEPYLEIAKKLEALPVKVEMSRLFQVDMVKPDEGATLGQNVVDEILKGIGVLQMCAPSSPEDVLTRFAKDFSERYESREIPLAEALDEEVGIGFQRSNAPAAEASPLLEGLAFPSFYDGDTTRWGTRERRLLQRLQEAHGSGAREIEVGEEDFKHFFPVYPKPLPDAFSVMACVAAKNPEEIDRGNFRLHIKGCSGPSGANLLGRFCHGDPALTQKVKEHIGQEEGLEPDAIFAEVVHLPEGRVGNILLRPHLRGHEIPFLGRSALSLENQISVDDLTVAVVGGQVVLRSRRLGKRILPRLTSAHGYFNEGNLGLYKFLGALQWQGLNGGLSWSWGPLEKTPFLPRVCSGKLVLSRARWNVGREEWEPISKAKGEERVAKLREWAAKRGIPRLAALADHDNELPVDFENPLSVEAFLDTVKRRAEFTLKEIFPESEELAAFGPEGRFVSEIVMPFVRKREPSASGKTSKTAGLSKLQRSFVPGSEWLFAKFYTGSATADAILREAIGPLARTMLGSGACDRWYFIRYADPEWHLRVRFHGDPARLAQEVFPALQAVAAPRLEDGRIWRMQLDTYEREAERYGGDAGIELAESLFHADSEAAVAMLERFSGDELADARWKLALIGIDRLLGDLGMDLKAKHEALKKMAEAFRREFRAERGYMKIQLGDKYRKERKALESLFDPAKEKEIPLAAAAAEIFSSRSQRHAPILAALQAAQTEGKLSSKIEELIPSYVHMQCNRFLRSAARAQELVIYDFLERIYESRIARARGKS